MDLEALHACLSSRKAKKVAVLLKERDVKSLHAENWFFQ